jgi:phosphoserine phosphatase
MLKSVVKVVLMLHIYFDCSFNKSLFGLVAISSSSSNVGATSVLSSASVMPQIPSLVRNGTSAANTTSITGSKSADRTKRVLEAKEIIRTADIVCFDVDSTVIQEEGIDELADFCGKGQEVANLTREALGGSMTFQEALRRRLDIIKPSQKQIRDFLSQRPSTLSPGIK